jgi:NADPH:quinone reductase-like Zn-dependent oxidoreductase
MQAVLLQASGGPLTVGQIPVPEPGPGQLLLRMAAAPINPSDLGFLKGSYGFRKPFPIVPGLEGSGTVIAAGSGLLPRFYLGKRVACGTAEASGGTWAEYMVTSATTCFPLAKKLSLEQGATLIFHSMTALAFFDIARRGGHRAIVSNAAAGALGRMILRLGQACQIPVIHLVRRQEQVELLRSLGGEHVLNSHDPDFVDRLRTLSRQLQATLILDPVAGRQTRQLLDAAPVGSTVLVYGRMSGEGLEPALQGLDDGDKRVDSFFLPDWLAKKNILQVLLFARRVQRLAAHELQTTIRMRFPLSAVRQAIEAYTANLTAGKVLLMADTALGPTSG